ncbi:MAG: LacI family transcriptional regulator [Treponema sp.]|jgi:DNA-binding LacI/PurR family transcriptional regulator|nr:LacI family transcriptional regulator [Treponema sp.]
MANRKDVARKAGVSITVVSRVMSNTGYVSREKREAVLRAAGELNYRPSPVARSLQKGRTGQVLFYRGDLSSAYYLELHRGMTRYAEKLGYLVCISGGLRIERIGELLMDGIILPTEAYARPEYLRYLRKYHMPYVVIGYGDYVPENVYSVTVDTGLAMRELITYLQERGHRRIAFINGNNPWAGEPRGAAFRAAMEGFYGDKTEDYVIKVPPASEDIPTNDYYRIGYNAAEEFTRRKLDATAVICFNDETAVGFYRRALQLGRRVPEDLSLVSFDGLVLGEYMTPALTSMDLHPFEHGKKCAGVLLDLLQGKRPGRSHRVDFSLIERESVRLAGA